jgi:AraC-like DNA-binding protein
MVHIAKIAAGDIEELAESVFPWQLRMSQLERGKFAAHLDCANLDGMLLTRERWHRRVMAKGATPEGFVAFAAPYTERTINWCGYELSDSQIACQKGAIETDFLTPKNSDHWVMIVPHTVLTDYLGEETACRVLTDRRVTFCEPSVTARIGALIKRAVRLPAGGGQVPDIHLPAETIRANLLESIATVLIGDENDNDHLTPSSRYLVVRRSIEYAESLQYDCSVLDLADSAGVSRRELERAFRQTLDTSPYNFLRLSRLNNLHRELLKQERNSTTVTKLALGWGFAELGRTAVEYRKLFGQSPSLTLSNEVHRATVRLGDVLST